jgi:hypothetical protein
MSVRPASSKAAEAAAFQVRIATRFVRPPVKRCHGCDGVAGGFAGGAAQRLTSMAGSKESGGAGWRGPRGAASGDGGGVSMALLCAGCQSSVTIRYCGRFSITGSARRPLRVGGWAGGVSWTCQGWQLRWWVKEMKQTHWVRIRAAKTAAAQNNIIADIQLAVGGGGWH